MKWSVPITGKKIMKSILIAAAALVAASATIASAGQPANPGVFGRDRAAYIHENFQNGGALDTAPGASEWGQIAGERAGTNGAMNREYKTMKGGDPTHGSEAPASNHGHD